MTTINLYQDQQEIQKKLASNSGYFSSGVIFSLGILIATLLVFLGLKFYVSMAEKKNVKMSEEIGTQTSSLASLSDLERVIDLQKRTQLVKDNLKIENGSVLGVQMTKVLDDFERSIDRNVIVSNFAFDESGKIKITFEANNFSDISRQIIKFKSSENFKSVILDKIGRKEKNISCDVEISLGK